MATNLDVSGLTLNPLENDSFQQFIIERTFDAPAIEEIHAIETGVKMKSQITFTGNLGLTGIADSGCTRPNSGAKAVLTQKYWEPISVGDTLIHCNKDLNDKFKAYFTKVQKYMDNYDIEGSDLQKFLLYLVANATPEVVQRLTWFGDTAVAASGAATAGLIDAVTNTKFFNLLDGLWKQIFADATIPRYTIAKNAELTKALQTTLATGYAKTVMDNVYKLADSRLRTDMSAMMLLSRDLYDNYVDGLVTKSENFTIETTQNGLQAVNYKGHRVINMENIWRYNDIYFEGKNDHSIYYLPNRCVFTVKENIPIGTLNDSDMETLENFFDQKDRTNYTAYGFTLDAKVLESYMIAVGY